MFRIQGEMQQTGFVARYGHIQCVITPQGMQATIIAEDNAFYKQDKALQGVFVSFVNALFRRTVCRTKLRYIFEGLFTILEGLENYRE